MKKNILTLLTLFAAFSFSFAGSGGNVNDLRKKAKKELEVEHYHNAAKYLEQVVIQEPQDAWAHYELGISYLHTNSFEEALLHIQKAHRLDPDHGVDKLYHYWLGKAYHQNHNFEEAITEYDLYEQKFRANDDRREELETLKQQARVGKKHYANPNNVLIINLGFQVNSEFDEHSPVPAADGNTVYFTTKKLYQGHENQDSHGEYYETIFVTKRNNIGLWSVPAPVGGALDNLNSHDACVQIFDHDTKMLMHTQSGNGDIYLAEKDIKGNWITSQPLHAVNSKKLEEDATITRDGKMMIFSSEASARRSDLDLFYITKNEKDEWSEPISLGNTINTEYEEEAPFITKDGKTLFFSSNGDRSMGGYDIFKSILLEDGTWSEPENLGFPINSVYHDIYYQLNETETMAYFSSHREGGQGELDIYAIYPVQMVDVKGSINKKAIEGDTTNLHVYFNSVGENQMPFSGDVDVSEDGKFSEKLVSNNTYDVIITNGADTVLKDMLQVEKTMELGTTQDYALLYKEEIPEDGIKVKLTSDEIISALQQGYGVSLVLFDYNKTDLRPEAKVILDQLAGSLNENEEIKVTLEGHTDNIGSPSFNQKLSLKRATSAANYLTSKGVNTQRIATEGKGETAPLVPNTTQEGRDRNRRIEIKFQAK